MSKIEIDPINLCLVLGDGLLGSELVKQTSWDYISRKKDGFDVSNPSSWKFSNYKIIVNCIANTDTYSDDRESHWLVNYKFVHDLIQYCNLHKIKLIHISTTYLYSDSVDYASEDDIPIHGKNWYGYTKLLGDGLVQLLSNNYLICRCMHKPKPFPYDSAWIDQVGNFDHPDVISDIIIKCIQKDLNGVYNIGTELKSMYEFAKLTNPNVEPILAPKNAPKNLSMSIAKIKNKMNDYYSIDTCPITGDSKKIPYFNLGNFPLVNELNNTFEESINCERYPLSINLFPESRLTALSISIDSGKLFSEYLFKSGVNQPYYAHCKKMFNYIKDIIGIDENDLIIDIGGNDGTLLAAFREESDKNLEYLNIDPSENISKLSIERGIPTLVEFFSKETIKLIPKKAKVITSTNVFQHLRDINSFVDGVYGSLQDNGAWVLEFPYWIYDMETNQFDQIYHEHVYYYSVTPLKILMEKHGFRIARIEKQTIHGGTLRLTMVKNTSNITSDNSILKFIDDEKKYDNVYYVNWNKKVRDYLSNCKNIIMNIKKDNKRISAFGASAKGCIFINSLGLTHETIDFIVDDTDIKQGKFMPGTGIKIVNREFMKKNKVDYLIILTHNFSEFIIKSLENEYHGDFITFLPELKIIKSV